MEAMKELGLSMKRSTNRLTDVQRGTPPPAAYTYFGQLIAHDLTLDQTPLPRATGFASIPAETVNAADARLNLNHLYGFGPGSAQHGSLYAEDGASFRIATVQKDSRCAFDFPMGEYGPESAEDRNLENVILRQICAMFLKLHNCAVEELSSAMDPIERFNRARNRVCWQYQWLVREDFLEKTIDEVIRRKIIRRGQHCIDWQSKGFAIPVEFSQAVFRFGHSLVRDEYFLSQYEQNVPLEHIFDGRRRFKSLDPKLAIDWERFLPVKTSNNKPVPAMAIDTTIVTPLFHLPSDKVHHLTDFEAPPLPPQLPVRTLLRGASTRLVNGERLAQELELPTLQEKKLSGGEVSWRKLDELNLTNRTPLWYYILLEAELEQRGERLGPVGSQLVAEVIDGSLKTDLNSYLSCFSSNWKPPAWSTRSGPVPIRHLSDLATVVGLVG